ncbi:scavenger mRNA-decapping enzyme DcpS [Ceratobasidium sp. AG-Ba]|nr:scavenger mRNA-decapping enzyme DcpS [Ceratobasidium sp. AG-Ba]QRW14691.1 aprataxin [Ceratobasidium sp. AG-Ba]
MQQDAEQTKAMIEDEMTKKYGFKWDVWIGFHAVPSMEHVHLHVLSSDLCAPALKKKHHYNSFRPDLGFFLHLKDVLSWFELPTATPFAKGPTFEQKAALSTQKYEPLLKKDLECFKCHETFKTLPQLRAHLQKEWDDLRSERGPKKSRKTKDTSPEGSEP